MQEATGGDAGFPRFRPLGDQAVLVQFGDVLSLETNGRMRGFAHQVRQRQLPGVTSLIPAQTSLAVRYDPVRVGYGELVERLKELLDEPGGGAAVEGKLVYVPVAYGGACGPDLEEVARRTGLAPEEVVARHHARTYVAYMVGFHAGFPYLGDNDEQLRLPRRRDPRVEVPAGSIGIAMNQSIIYTVVSPGGWHLIGRTPMEIFNPFRHPPGLLLAGDRVRFVPIPEAELEQWDETRQRDWDLEWNAWRYSNQGS